MAICDICGAKFGQNKHLLRHKREKHEQIRFQCVSCPQSFTRRDALTKHMTRHANQNPQESKKRRSSGDETSVKRVKLTSPSTSKEERPLFPNHSEHSLDSLGSEENVNLQQFMDHFDEAERDPIVVTLDDAIPDQLEELEVLGNAIFCARITPSDIQTDPEMFFNRHRAAIQNYLNIKLSRDHGIKWYITIQAKYAREIANTGEVVEALPYHRSTSHQTLTADVLARQLEACITQIKGQMEDFLKTGSGWVLDKILFLQVSIVTYLPLVGGTYIKLPKKLADKKAILNIKNTDNRCFIWSILAHLHPIDRKGSPERVRHYQPFQDELDFDGLAFPFELNVAKLENFEHKNNLSINVFCFEKGIFPRYISSNRVSKDRQVDLLLITEGEKRHYCLIRSLSRFLSGFVNHHSTLHYCRYCLHRFSGHTSELRRDEHVKDCSHHGPQKIQMPLKDPILEFKNYGWREKIKYVIFADFEAILPKIATCLPDASLSSTTRLTSHISSGFSYVIVGPDGKPTKPVTYRGDDSTDRFLEYLIKEQAIIAKKIKDNVPMQLTPAETADFANARSCYICDKRFKLDDIKVRDHDHSTGAYRGAAHNACNLKLKQPKFVPVFLHNLSRYDSHLIMQKIGLIKGEDIKCIATNSETYISFSLGNLRFLDTVRFMPASLQELAKNLSNCGTDKFTCMNGIYSPEEVQLLLRKQVYPYNYMDNVTKFDEGKLPPRDAFFNDLTDEDISEQDYEHAQNVWNKFNIRNLGEYHDLYVQSDTLLLADIFQNFRAICLDYYKLDCAHAFTGPGFAWESALYLTKVKLDLLVDPDMHLFIEKGIRGGVSMISHRLAEANNKHLPESFDDGKPSSFITYLDCNNLYGTVMCDKLPMTEFKWVDPSRGDTVLNHPDDDETGFILEVDLHYPQHLHDDHNCYPLAPEKRVITMEELSPYSKDQLRELGLKEKDSHPKLVPSLHKKEKYVLHYRNLKYYVTKGLIITKIHRILGFKQGAWLKPFIEFNTEKRKHATNDFEKNFFKLMNNAVYGKTMENLRNRIDFSLVNTPERAIKKANSPAFQRFSIFSNDLVGIHRVQKVLTLNRPIYTGFTVLDLSKLLMYEFHYDVIRKQYGDQAKLLFTDTDSLTYHIETEDLYMDFAEKKDMYDFSGYPKKHPLYSEVNKKTLGKFKDELDGTPAMEFVGLRPKMYSLLSSKGEKKTAKGICRRVVKKNVRHIHYKECLLNRKLTVAEMKRIISKRHEMFTVRQTKLCLNPCDDKRYIIDGVATLAHGHYKIKND